MFLVPFFKNFFGDECFECFEREREREREREAWVDSDVMEKDCEIKKNEK